jgi:hypothetical protein
MNGLRINTASPHAAPCRPRVFTIATLSRLPRRRIHSAAHRMHAIAGRFDAIARR